MTHFLGIDIGTFESKGVLSDGAGNIVASAARPHKMLVPKPGWAEHDAEKDWWGDLVFLCNALIAQSGIDPKSIGAIATSAIGPCMLPVDGAGDPLMNGVLYGVDTRASDEIGILNAGLGEDTILERCGNALTSQSAGPKILWLRRQRPELFKQAAKIVTSTSFLVYRLTGNWVIDHYTAASFSPLYLADEQGWSDELNAAIVPLCKLPEVGWSTEIAGHVTAGAAAQTGLAEGTPVTIGTIDAAAEAVSVGVRTSGDMLLMYGSTIFIILVTQKRLRDARLWYAPWLFPGQHASMAGLATSGTLSHWFRDQFARDLDPDTAFAELAAEAALSPPGARGLVVLPYFSGERTPIHDPGARGVIFGLDLTHTRGDIYRALFEGIACGTNHIAETFAGAGGTPRAIFAAGGGTKSTVWGQATSDVSGLTQIIREKTIGASYGNAFLAALATGDVAPEGIEAWNPVVSRIEPDPQNAAAYGTQFEIFKSLYPQTRDLMHKTGR